jgi:glyoxylase-like metal-dependent hydrolase (beta-lactamase superfamily II)
MATWSAAFGDCPVYVHAADAEWVQYPTPGLRLWHGETTVVLEDVTLINTGGHFAGATALHWADGHHGQGLLLSGDSQRVRAPDGAMGWVKERYLMTMNNGATEMAQRP